MADGGTSAGEARAGVMVGGILLAGSMALCASAVWFGPRLIADLALASPPAEIAAFYAIIYGPMLVCGLACAWFSGLGVLPLGHHRLAWAGAGLLAGAGGLGLAFMDAQLANIVAIGRGPGLTAAALAAGLAVTLFQCASEELLFRGWAQAFLVRMLGAGGGVFAAALLFTAFHALGGVRAPLAMVNLLLGGLWFGMLMLRSGGMIAPIAAHTAWNAAEDLGLGLVPNPGVGLFGSAVDHDLIGSALWGGGPDGLNASLGTTIVLAALILPLLFGNRATAPVAPGRHQPDPAAG